MSFNIRNTRTKLVAITGPPLSEKTTCSKILGEQLNATVLDFDTAHYTHIQEDSERAEYYTKVPMLPNENGRAYLTRCILSEIPKDNFVKWLLDAIPHIEERVESTLKTLTETQQNVDTSSIENGEGKLISFLPKYFNPEFLIANFAYLNKLKYWDQAHVRISSKITVDEQIRRSKIREGIVLSDTSYDLYLDGFAQAMGKVENIDILLPTELSRKHKHELIITESNNIKNGIYL